jgi:hypothetical protein
MGTQGIRVSDYGSDMLRTRQVRPAGSRKDMYNYSDGASTPTSRGFTTGGQWISWLMSG